MRHWRFVPVDDGAKTGKGHLLRDIRGHQHAGRWAGRAFVYSSGVLIDHAITDYLVWGDHLEAADGE